MGRKTIPFEQQLKASDINSYNRTPCIEWQGHRHETGYGIFKRNGQSKRAHRIAYEKTHGSIPKGMLVCHHCDNPPCCNIDHLFLGTHKDNADDRDAKGRGTGGLNKGLKQPRNKQRTNAPLVFISLHRDC